MTLPFTIIYVHEVRGVPLDVAGLLMGLIAVVALARHGAGRGADRPPRLAGGRRLGQRGPDGRLRGPGLRHHRAGVRAGVHAARHQLRRRLAGVQRLHLDHRLGSPAHPVLRHQLRPGQPRHRDRRHRQRVPHRRRPAGHVHGDLPRRRRHACWCRSACCSGRCGTSPAGPSAHRPAVPHEPAPATSPSCATPPSLWITALTFLSSFVGYGQMEAGFPAFARQVSEVSTRTIGLAFAANTVVIVGDAVPGAAVHRRAPAHPGLPRAGGPVGGWPGCCSGATGLVAGTMAAAAGVIVFHVLFGLGETMLQPTVPAIVNDLASDRDRGRFNAVSAGAFQVGAITAPVVAGWLLNRQLGGVVHRRDHRAAGRGRGARAGARAPDHPRGQRGRRAGPAPAGHDGAGAASGPPGRSPAGQPMASAVTFMPFLAATTRTWRRRRVGRVAAVTGASVEGVGRRKPSALLTVRTCRRCTPSPGRSARP